MPVTSNADRCLECPARTLVGTCAIVDRDAGWPMGMAMETCTECLRAGGVRGGEKVREAFLTTSIASLKTRLAGGKRGTVFAILAWHCAPDEAEALATPEVRYALDRDVLWSMSARSFDEAAHFQRGTLKDFLGAMWSRFWSEPISLQTLSERKMSCFGGAAVKPCPSLATAPDGVRHYCDACGCGPKEIAMLDDPKGSGRYTKLMYPNLKCPRRRKGFSNAELTVNGQPR